LKRRQILIGAALAAWAAGVTAAATHAQETNSTVGPPELRDFELPGSRTTPPPTETQPAETAPPPVTAQPEPPRAADTPAPAPTLRATPRPAPTARRAAPEQPTATLTPAPVAADPGPTLPTPSPELQPPVAAPASGAPGWLGWLAVLAGVLIAAGGFFLLGRKERGFAGASTEPAPAEPAAEPASAPIPAAAPPVTGGEREPRPWLELSFKPARAAATDSGAVLHYELSVRNVGQSAARNVRINARMFNAGADQDREIGAFFSATAEERDSGPLRMIMPGGQVPVRSTLTMPKEHVREYKVQGRSLFIPMVAFNVVYEWGDGRTGKTSMSYLVGQEAQTPSQKMGAFRLDLGPRIYRAVGQRQHKLAQMV
jgi:hypothetical protein